MISLKIFGFPRPSKGDCEICLSYKDHIKDSDHDSNQCTECRAYAKLKVRYSQARAEYQKPIPGEVVCFTADMKRVIILPKSLLKNIYLLAVWLLLMRHLRQSSW